MKSKAFVVFIGIIGVIFSMKVDYVHAEDTSQFYYSTWISGIYIRKEDKSTGYVQNQQARFTRRKGDGIPVYCVETGVEVLSDELYDANTDVDNKVLAKITGFTPEQINKVKLIAYYGYGYNGQYDDKWYAATQVLIWRTVYPNMDIYYTDKFKGEKIENLVAEEKQIMDLVNNHLLDFDFEPIDELTINDEITLTDKNNVLQNYDVESTDNIEVQKEDNSLIIKAKEVGDAKIKFTRKPNRFGYLPILYTNANSQDLIMAGDFDVVERSIDLTVKEEEIPDEPEEPEEPKEVITVEVPNTYQDENNLVFSSSIISIILGNIFINAKKENK